MASTLPSSVECCETALCVAPITVAVPGPPGPQGDPGEISPELVGWFVEDTLADVRILPALATNQFLIMLGGAAIGDGFGAQFFWDALSNDIDDYTVFGGSTINPNGNSGAGRWKRLI